MPAGDILPFYLRGVQTRVTVPILDADGDLVTAAASLDSEVSKDGGTFADCSNEATEIATSSGVYYLDLTATEMDAATVAVNVKTSTSGAKTTPIVLYTRVLPSLRTGTAQAGAASTVTLDSGASAANDAYNGCIVQLTGGTGSGQARTITDYVGSTKVATVSPSWGTNPDNTSTFSVLLTEVGVSLAAWMGTIPADPTTVGVPEVDLTHIAGSTVATSSAQLGVNVVNFGGSAGTFASGRPEVNTSHIAGSAVSTTTAQIGVNVVQVSGDAAAADNLEAAADGTGYNLGGGQVVAASVTGAVGSVTGAVGSVTGAVGSVTGNVGGNVTGSVGSIASGGITSGSFAAGAINAAAIAADAIGAAELAADAVAEIADAVWDEARSGHVTAGTFGEYVLADAVRISGDATAADNLEAASDGTGYNLGAGLVVAASVTGNVGGNVTGSVGSVASGGITSGSFAAGAINAAAIATNAIDADALAADAVTEIQSGLSTLTASQVNAEVLDVLTVDTFTEPAAVPAATASLKDKIGWVTLLHRNKRAANSTTETVYADNESTVIATGSRSDSAGTFTRGEYS